MTALITSCFTVIDERLASDMTCAVRSVLYAIAALQAGSRSARRAPALARFPRYLAEGESGHPAIFYTIIRLINSYFSFENNVKVYIFTGAPPLV